MLDQVGKENDAGVEFDDTKLENFVSSRKVAKVTPLHKGGARNDINNYRPISVLPVFSKIIEKHVASCLLNFLHDNNMLYDMTTTCYMSINQLSGQVTLQKQL